MNSAILVDLAENEIMRLVRLQNHMSTFIHDFMLIGIKIAQHMLAKQIANSKQTSVF